MSRARIRVLLAAALVVTNFLILVGPLHAAGNMVTGTLQLREKVALSPLAVAVITLADRSPDGAGTIIGQQRIDGATGNDAFAVQFDPGAINSKHAYSIYASLIDGSKQWQNPIPVPTITGGPLDGLVVPISQPSYQTPAQITGTIAIPNGVTLTSTAVAYAAILDATTGRLVARQVIPTPATLPAPFTVAFDAALINPTDSYVATAAVIDAPTLYQAKSTTPITPDATFNLTVAKTSTVIPGPGASSSPAASSTPVATVTPGTSASPTEQPSGGTPNPSKTPKPTEVPTVTPTLAPTATPVPTATAVPTASPTEVPASATPVASASAQPSGSAAPSESPGPLTVTGQASYTEPATLSGDAVLTVVVVQVDSNGPNVVVVGEQEVKPAGPVPIAFSVTLDPALLVTTNDAFLYATLVDGTNAWTTDGGVKVATNGAPTDNVQVPLVFRPDLIEGEVTGAITGIPSNVSLSAWAMAFVLDQTDGTILGLQSGPIFGSTLVPFEIPFRVADLDPTKTYVAAATVFDNTQTYRSDQGVPVITNGNPYSGVVLPVIAVGPSATPTAVATPTAAATVAATVHPVATATPAASNGSGGGVDPLLIAGIAGLVIIGLIAVVAFMRRSRDS